MVKERVLKLAEIARMKSDQELTALADLTQKKAALEAALQDITDKQAAVFQSKDIGTLQLSGALEKWLVFNKVSKEKIVRELYIVAAKIEDQRTKAQRAFGKSSVMDKIKDIG